MHQDVGHLAPQTQLTFSSTRTSVTWTIGTSSNTGWLLPWGMASGQCKWQYSLAAPATVCDQRSSAAGSQPAPSRWSHRQPREPPCACAPAPGDKLLCADGLDEGARLLWRRDKPALPMRPWARKKEPEIDPFVILSTVQGSVAPPWKMFHVSTKDSMFSSTSGISGY